MNRILFGLLTFCLSVSAFAFDHAHSKLSLILKGYQNSQGLLNYKKLKTDSVKKDHAFNQYLTEIQQVRAGDFEAWTKQQQMAFLINAYNALTIKLIVDHYPVASIKKIGGLFTKPWSVEFFKLLGGQITSLDPIEHEWLRPKYKDFRIHAAVNCASISCPPLRNEAFVAEKLEAQLDEQMRAWLSDPARNNINPQTKVFKVSKIFDWYEKDFTQWGGGVAVVIGKYMTPPLTQDVAKKMKIEYVDYNWNLNEAK